MYLYIHKTIRTSYLKSSLVYLLIILVSGLQIKLLVNTNNPVRWEQLGIILYAQLCRSYPCPGSIAMIAFLQASRFCASFGSSWRCFISLSTLSNHLSLGLPRGLFPPLPSHLHLCYFICNMCFFSSHYMAIPRKAFLGDIYVVIDLTIASLLNFSFLIRSFLVLP